MFIFNFSISSVTSALQYTVNNFIFPFFKNTFSALSLTCSPRKGHVHTKQGGDHLQDKKKALVRTQHTGTLTVILPAPWTMRQIFLLFKSCYLWYFVMDPELTKMGSIKNLSGMRKTICVSCFTYIQGWIYLEVHSSTNIFYNSSVIKAPKG